jgi:proton-dependent oligopeptide transporter, POT family
MEQNQIQKHSKETLYYSISRMLERSSYYGLRSLVILYMIGETLKMEYEKAILITGWFTTLIVFSQIVGAIFGDLIIGNKKSILLGGFIQAVGAFSLCLPSTTGLYLGLFLIVLGGGFYSPNIIANFGKSYLNKTKLLDSGFTIFYLAINLGSFLGIFLISYIAETFNYTIGFVIAGLLLLVSLIPIVFTKEKASDEIMKSHNTINKRVLNILIAFVVVGLFWCFHELSSHRTFNVQFQLGEISALDIPMHFWGFSSSFFALPVCLIAAILWTYLYTSQFFKLLIGFIFGAISFGLLFLIPDVPAEKHAITFLASLLFFAIAEIHVAPLIHSILTKYTNPKYLAILISLAFLPTRLITLFLGLFDKELDNNPMLGLKIGIIGMTVVGIGLLVYVWWNKKTPSTFNK